MSIVSRSKWGARPPKTPPQRVTWPRGVTLWLHHTAGPPSQTPAEIQAYHQNSNGWSDIGYSFLVREDGTVYEGRGVNVRGAHSPSKNHEPSVALIGTYTDRAPTDAQARAVWDLRAMLGAGAIRGHRDSYPTSCPGDAAYRKVITAGRPAPVKLTLRQRLLRGFRKAGFGGKSAKQATDKYLKERGK